MLTPAARATCSIATPPYPELSSAAETGATFSVKNAGGTTQLAASVGPNLGSWSNAYPFVYALDFGAVTAPGTYSIQVSGPAPATIPSSRSSVCHSSGIEAGRTGEL